MGPVEQDPRHAGDHEPVHDPDATCPGRVERSNRCSRPWWASRPPCWKPAASCHSSSSAGPPARRRGSSWAAGLGPPAVGDLRLCNRELAGPRRQRVGSAPELDDPDPPCSRITGSAGLTILRASDTDLANEPVHWLPPAAAAPFPYSGKHRSSRDRPRAPQRGSGRDAFHGMGRCPGRRTCERQGLPMPSSARDLQTPSDTAR
jgi:hypothetical protein